MEGKKLVIGAAAIGAIYLIVKSGKDRKRAKVKEWFTANITESEKHLIKIFDKMTDAEISTVYDVFVIRKYGDSLPAEIANQITQISKKYNIFT